MLDPKRLRNETETIAAALHRRGSMFDQAKYQTLETKRKSLQIEVETLQSSSKKLAKEIATAKREADGASVLLERAAGIKQQIEGCEKKLHEVREKLEAILLELPNIPDDSVPDGKDESDNIEIRRWSLAPNFQFIAKDHVDLAEGLAMMSTSIAAKLAGTRFAVFFDDLALLHRALIRLMLDTHVRQHGYREVYVPYLANHVSLRGTGQLPKFSKDLFEISNSDFYLIPTAEVPLTNICRDKIIDANDLPLKFAAHTPCFRSEAGSYGKDTRGILRQHQFEKVELVQIVEAKDSPAALEELTGHAEKILQLLELPYRVVELCSRDLGFSSAKTYDIEVWLPGQKRYFEVSSCSNMTDFQARRMQARVRYPSVSKPKLVHTLNGSGLAAGRTLAALLENYQTEDGSIRIPEALLLYMEGKALIKADKIGF